MCDASEELFDRLGGPEGVMSIVVDMYKRVMKDPELAHFFENVQMERLHRMQFQFVASAFDGPVKYTGAELYAIHKGRGITGHHFSKFCGYFSDAMEAHGAKAHDVDLALSRLATYRDKIVGKTTEDG